MRMRPDTLPGSFSTSVDRIVPNVGHAIVRWSNHWGQSANAQYIACNVLDFSGRRGFPGHTSSMYIMMRSGRPVQHAAMMSAK
eukprot:9480513-Pyramimonas_sp.AAC.1